MAYKTYETKSKSKLDLDALRKKQEVKSPASYDPAKQTEGYKKRLEGSGIDVEKAMDKRNFVEKGLNLQQGQNALFDIFEILERPQQAIFGGIKALQEGGSFGEGMKAGITGNDITRFKEILHEAGMENTEGFGIDDVLGFAGDVLLDPADLAIWAGATAAAPLTAGGSYAAAGAITTALNAATDAGKFARTGKTLLKGAKAADKSIDALKNTMKIMGDAKIGRKARKSTTEVAMRAGSKAIKGGFGVANKGAKKVLGFIDKRSVGRGIEGAGNLVESYEGFLKSGHKMFTNLASVPQNVYDSVMKASGMGNRSKHEMKILWEGAQKKIDDIASKRADEFGGDLEKARNAVFEDLTEYKELTYEAKTDVRNVLENKERWDMPIDEAVADNVRKVINNPLFEDVMVGSNATLKARSLRGADRSIELAKANTKVRDEVSQKIKDYEKIVEEEIKKAPKPKKQATVKGKKPPKTLDPARVKEDLKKIKENVNPGKPTKPTKATKPPKTLDPKKVKEDLKKIKDNVNPGKPTKTSVAVKSKKLQEAEKALEQLKDLKKRINRPGGAKRIQENLELIKKSGAFSDDAVKTLEDGLRKFIDGTKADKYNVFDDLYEKVKLPNGQDAYRLREGKETIEMLNAITKRFDEFSKRFDEADLISITNKRFGDEVATKLKKLFDDGTFKKLSGDHPLSGKKFDDLFELKNGVWEVKDDGLFDELIDLINPQDRAALEIGGSRFLTDERINQLKTKFNNLDANTKNMYDEIAGTYDDLAVLNDKLQGTSIANKVDGYLHHAVSDEVKATPGKLQQKLDRAKVEGVYEPIVFTGNTKVFKGRKYNMSVEEANMIAKDNAERLLQRVQNDPSINLNEAEFAFLKDRKIQDLFSKSINDSVSDMIESSAKYSSDINKLHKALVGSTFTNDNIFRPAIEDAAGNVVKPKGGFVVVNGTDVRDKIKRMSKALGSESKIAGDFEDFLKSFVGSGKYEMDANVFNMIGVLDPVTNKHFVQDLTSMVDTVNNLFKKNKLLSPGFQMRNLVGNATNLYLAGVKPLQIPGILKDGHRVLKNGAEHIRVLQKAGLTGIDIADERMMKQVLQEFSNAGMKNPEEALREFKYYARFLEGNFDDAGSAVQGIDEILKKTRENRKGVKNPDMFDKTVGRAKHETYDRVVDWNATMNESIDKRYRLGFMMAAEKNPEIMKNLGVESAEAAVRRVLFDPRDLTKAEKDYFKRLVPFYTFAKKNLAYQIQNLPNNAVRYKRLKKTVSATWDFAGGDFENIENYKKENFWIPVPGTKVKDGKYKALKLNLPVGDLADFLDSPSRKIVSSLSPVFRIPYEMVSNKQTFTQRPIQDFEGQRGYQLPELSRKQEYLLGQTGLDVPATAVADAARTILRPKDSFGENIEQALGRSVVSSGDEAKAQRSKQYEELQQVKDLMSYFKQEGVPVLTLSEIENNKPKQNNLLARLQALGSTRR